jgi:hypothetical protein
MANSITALNQTFLGYNVDVIREEVLKVRTLTATHVPLGVFTTKFNTVPDGVTTVTIPLPTYPTGSANQNPGSSGVTTFDAVANSVTVKIDTDTGVFYPFNPVEIQNNSLETIVQSFLSPAIYGVERTLLSASLGIGADIANFNSSSFKSSASAAVSASFITSLKAEMSTANINGEQFILWEPNRFWNLVSNLSSLGNAAGAAAIQNGDANNPFGVVIKECQTLPTTNNLVGIGGVKTSIVLATAIPTVKHANGEAFIMTTPAGASILVEQYYDEFRRQWLIGASVLYKAVKGVGGIFRYVSS